MDIPSFDTAVESFRSFVGESGHPTTIAWVFRDDLVTPRQKGRIRNVLPPENQALARKVFEEGRAKGLVEIIAVGTTGQFTAATVWFPRSEEEEVQGWNQGMKLSILEPLPSLRSVTSRFAWWLVTLSMRYRLFQHREGSIPTREWAAA